MIDTPHIEQTDGQQAAVIRFTIPREQIPEVMGAGIQELLGAIEEQDIAPAGPIFSHHLRMDPETFDFEIGVPVAQPVEAAGRVKPGELPGARVVQTVYHGPYEGLPNAWGEFDKWIASEGLEPRADLWERYVTGPESSDDPEDWRTELNRPLRG